MLYLIASPEDGKRSSEIRIGGDAVAGYGLISFGTHSI